MKRSNSDRASQQHTKNQNRSLTSSRRAPYERSSRAMQEDFLDFEPGPSTQERLYARQQRVHANEHRKSAHTQRNVQPSSANVQQFNRQTRQRLDDYPAKRSHNPKSNIFTGRRVSFTAKRFFMLAATALIFVGVLFGIDTFNNRNTIYHGVYIGDVCVAGMTTQQAAEAVHSFYDVPFSENEIYIFADDETKNRYDAGEDVFTDEQVNEDSFGSSHAWQVSSDSLQATLDVDNSVAEAFKVGKGFNITQRLHGWLGGVEINPVVQIPDASISTIANHINNTSGVPMVENEVSVDDGVAYVTPGQDGVMVRNAELKQMIASGLLHPSESTTIIVPTLYDTPRSYDEATAQTCADGINHALQVPVSFIVDETEFELSGVEIGSWIETEFTDGILRPVCNTDLGARQLMHYAHEMGIVSEHAVTFDTSGTDVLVSVSSDGQIPQYQNAVDLLTHSLFTDETLAGTTPASVTIEVPYASITDKLSFDEAVRLGVITKISTYTTDYTPDDTERNFNIHHMADLLHNSVAPAQSTWSILDTAGEISENAGYKSAGQIVDGEVVKDYGGGVCQVATTVFNAVYEAGYPITMRFNHSLYMSTYPDGRDAAIAWPDLDLRWKNDTDSDVLVTSSYTDTTVTITLWGVNPDYQVSTELSAWIPADPYKIKVTYDPNQDTKKERVEKKGKDGKSIQATRSVTDRNGTILHEDVFNSTYDPVNQIVVLGGEGTEKLMTQEEYDKLLEKRDEDAKKAKEESDKSKADANKEAA